MTVFAAARLVRDRLAARLGGRLPGGVIGAMDVAALDDLPTGPCAAVLPESETSQPSQAPEVGSYARRVATVAVHVVVPAWPTDVAAGGTGQSSSPDSLGDLVTDTRAALEGWRYRGAPPSTDALHLASGRLYAAEAGAVHWVDLYELGWYGAHAPDSC